MGYPEDEHRPASSQWGEKVGSQREDQYTPMGENQMYGDFASSAHRSRGWARWVLIALVVLVLVTVGVGYALGL